MNMNLNVLSKTRSLAPITAFYCNKRIDILLRIKSFAKRIRFNCKLHNQLLYGNDNKLVEENKFKLQNDDVDYFKTTQFIIEELVVKSSFLSNHDSILILDILSRIKNPLEKICSKKYQFHSSLENDHIITNNSTIKYGTISRIISRGQISLLKHLIKSEESMTLTNIERYYLIIALSRDCGLISFSTWMKLFENVHNVLVTKTPESLYGYKPYQIANLLLTYDQISRWSYKRQNNNSKMDNILKDNKVDIYDKRPRDSNSIETSIQNSLEKYNQLNKLDNELQLKSIEKRTYNPFNLDIINIGISRLEKCIDQLKSEKIIKILYLINSRKNYSNRLFQNSLIYFESEDVLKSFKLSEIHTLFNLYSRGYLYHLLRHIESFIYFNNISREDLDSLLGTNVGLLGTEVPERTLGRDTEVGVEIGTKIKNIEEKDFYKDLNMDILKQIGRVNTLNTTNGNQHLLYNTNYSFNSLDDEIYKFNTSESMCLCTIIISLEYFRRLSKIDKESFLDQELISEKIQEIFGKDHEWNDILSFLEKRMLNNENELIDEKYSTDVIQNKKQISEFLEKNNTFSRINKYLIKLFNVDQKYENRVKRVEFCVKILDSIMLHTTHSLITKNPLSFTTNQHNINIESLNTTKSNITTTSI